MAVGQKHWGVVMFGCCFQSPWQKGCRWWHGETKKPHTETEMPVFYCAHVSKTDACLTCWSIPFNRVSMKELAFRIPAYWLAFFFFCCFLLYKVLQAFLTFVPSESYSCSPNLHLKASSPLRAFLRNGNLSPHPEGWFLNGVQADDFSWMGVF